MGSENFNTVLVALDCETTGLTSADDFVQLGAVFHVEHSTSTASFCEYAMPGKPIAAGAKQTHGITEEYLESKGAKPSYEVAEQFAAEATEYIAGRPYIIAGHNLSFDMGILGNHGCLKEFIDGASGKICTRRTAERLVKGLPNYKLDTVADYYGANRRNRKPHDALSDADIVFRIVRVIKSTENLDYAGVAGLLTDPRLLEVMPFGQNKGLPFSQIEASYLKWIVSKGDDMNADVLFSAKAELDRREAEAYADEDVPY